MGVLPAKPHTVYPPRPLRACLWSPFVLTTREMTTKNSKKHATDLCKGCDVEDANNAAGNSCKKYCPFNSDEAPPKLDDRSDAKGPEPNSIATGITADGRHLAFVGLERTGGVMILDVTDPANAKFQVCIRAARAAHTYKHAHACTEQRFAHHMVVLSPWSACATCPSLAAAPDRTLEPGLPQPAELDGVRGRCRRVRRELRRGRRK